MAQRNVLGGDLQACSTRPLTGFYRDGCCTSGPEDIGSHTICAVVTAEFLEHQRRIGNDLVTPHAGVPLSRARAGRPLVRHGRNWLRAYRDGAACFVVLASTNQAALEIVPREALEKHAVDVPPTSTASTAPLSETVPAGAVCRRVCYGQSSTSSSGPMRPARSHLSVPRGRRAGASTLAVFASALAGHLGAPWPNLRRVLALALPAREPRSRSKGRAGPGGNSCSGRRRILGPSKARSASVIIDMFNPAVWRAAQRWATEHRLTIQWYTGHAVGVLSATPVVRG